VEVRLAKALPDVFVARVDLAVFAREEGAVVEDGENVLAADRRANFARRRNVELR
jgi:hypothetical protein